MDELLAELGCNLVRFSEETREAAKEVPIDILTSRMTEAKVLIAISQAGRYFDEAVEALARNRWYSGEGRVETLNRERNFQQTLAAAGITDEEGAIAWLTEAEQRVNSARAEHETLEQRHRDEFALFWEKLSNGQSVVNFSVGDRVKVVFTDDRVAEKQGFTTKIRAIGLDGTMYLDIDGIQIRMGTSRPLQLSANSCFFKGLCQPHPAMSDYAIELTKIA